MHFAFLYKVHYYLALYLSEKGMENSHRSQRKGPYLDLSDELGYTTEQE